MPAHYVTGGNATMSASPIPSSLVTAASSSSNYNISSNNYSTWSKISSVDTDYPVRESNSSSNNIPTLNLPSRNALTVSKSSLPLLSQSAGLQPSRGNINNGNNTQRRLSTDSNVSGPLRKSSSSSLNTTNTAPVHSTNATKHKKPSCTSVIVTTECVAAVPRDLGMRLSVVVPYGSYNMSLMHVNKVMSPTASSGSNGGVKNGTLTQGSVVREVESVASSDNAISAFPNPSYTASFPAEVLPSA
uniref:Uncharacterized protein n=1 Tax=Lygus hesperus TaxID=30085 RepID=A0A146MCG6_LYGHE